MELESEPAAEKARALVNIKLELEYDGSGFHGWQRQPGGLRTIQSELERVLAIVLRSAPISLTPSGRTDAGVHARRQTANFKLAREVGPDDLHAIRSGVSSLLKGEVAVLSAALAPMEFDACRDAKRKQYSYWILTRAAPAVLDKGRVWHLPRALDTGRMQDEADSIVGVHDFTSLRGHACTAKSPIREILSSRLSREGDFLVYRVQGSGFLKQMVRNIVGTLVGIGKGTLAHTSMREILAAKDRRAAGVTAPPYGLFLDWVEY